jgi:outer membrane protein OmpA-like peptidoglycan-associated protein
MFFVTGIHRHLFVLLVCLNVVSQSRAQDIEGAADHPLFKRHPAFLISEFNASEYEVADYWVKTLNRGVKMGGKSWRIVYVKNPESTAQLSTGTIVNHITTIAKAGGMTLENEDIGGYATVRVTRGATETWAKLEVWDNGGSYLLQITEKPADSNPYREPDAGSSKDHPAFSRMTNYYISEFYDADFDGEEFWIKATEQNLRKEGRKTTIVYGIRPDLVVRSASATQIVRNYINAGKKAGFSVENEDNNGYATLSKGDDGSAVWVKVEVWDEGRAYKLVIVEEAPVSQEVNAQALFDTIQKSGRIALYINFDTGSYAVPPEAEPQLEQIVSMMIENPSLKLSIEGHTDNTGQPDGNLRLSDARAQSIRQALIDKGIEAARLNAKGLGRTKPLTGNDTEEGRAKNRRVELVKAN